MKLNLLFGPRERCKIPKVTQNKLAIFLVEIPEDLGDGILNLGEWKIWRIFGGIFSVNFARKLGLNVCHTELHNILSPQQKRMVTWNSL